MTTTLAWGAILLAASFEIVIALALKEAAAFTRPLPTAVTLIAALGSLSLLSFAMTRIPVGTAYAVWVGLGAAAVAVAGIAVYDESTSPARLACIALIALGVAGLKLGPA